MANTLHDLHSDTIKTLHALTRVLHASQTALTDAGAQVSDPQAAQLFYDLGTKRAKMEHELRQFIETKQDEAPSGGTMMGNLQTMWMELRTSLSGGDATVVLGEMERLEDFIVAEYKRLLPKVAGSPLTSLLNNQFAEVKQGHDRVRDLRDLKREQSS